MLVSFFAIAQKGDFTTISAEIANPKGDSIFIMTADKHKVIQTLVAKEKGVFIDSFKVVTDKYVLIYDNKTTPIYLENGFDLILKFDAKLFDETVVYSGIGSVENNYLAQNVLYNKGIYFKRNFGLEEAYFIKLLNKAKEDEMMQLQVVKLNPVFVDFQTKLIQENYDEAIDTYKKYNKNRRDCMLIQSKLDGAMCPSFEYVNHKVGKTKLEDFKGKYIYIDIWSTTCAPCIVEIPFLKKIEEEFYNKNIVFVSISIDVKKNDEKWRNFVKDKNLGGVQLLADNSWDSDFIKSCGVNNIPRFILIDPTGRIIKGNAARPSNPELTKELDELLN